MVIYGLQCFSIRKIMENWSVELCLTASCRRVQHFSIFLVAYEPNGWHLMLMAKWRNCPKNRALSMQKLKIEDWNAHGLAVRRFRRWDADRDGRWEATSWKNLVGLVHHGQFLTVPAFENYVLDISKTQLAWISVSETHKQPFLYSLLSALFTSLLSSVLYSLHFSTVLRSLLKSSLQISLRLLLDSFNCSTYTLFTSPLQTIIVNFP